MPAQELSKIANKLRVNVLKMVANAGAGHVAGPLSSAEIMTCLYLGGVAEIPRDKVILSCGHYVPIQYAALVEAGHLPESELLSFMQTGSRLPGHPERWVTPLVEVSAGPLGQGVSVAVGMALGYKLKRQMARVYCIVSDGELEEGQVWEAFNTAVSKQLSNLTFIIDKNNIQIEHFVSEIVDLDNLEGRLESFGFFVLSTDGNDVHKITQAIRKTQEANQPSVVVAKTVAGKGVSFMENDPKWHDKVPSKSELERAIHELSL